MAIRIPVYTQQTGTPQGRVAGANLTTDVGPNVGGALLDAAQGVGMFARARKDKMDELAASEATAYSSQALATFQREAIRKAEEFKSKTGPGGKGYAEMLNGWGVQEKDAIIAAAPNEQARKYLQSQMTDTLTRLDASAFDYEITEGRRQVIGMYENGIKAGADTALASPENAALVAAQQLATIKADKSIDEAQRAALVTAVTSEISYAAVLGDIQTNPYGAQKQLLARFGFGPSAEGEVDQGVIAGIAAEGMRRVAAGEDHAKVESWMNEAMTKAGMTVDTSRAGEEVTDEPGGDGRTWAYSALDAQQVVSLISKVQADIARMENEAKQAADFGKIEFDQRYQDKMIALGAGESVADLPSEATLMAVYGPEQGAIKFRNQGIVQANAGVLQTMAGQTNAELVAMLASPPTGTDNREFREASFEVRARRAAAILKAREDDPGGFVLAESPIVSQSFAEWQAASQSGDQAAATAAQNKYITASMAEQTRIGILQPKLPEAFLKGVAQDLATGLDSNDTAVTQAAVQRVRAAAASLLAGGHVEAAAQIAKLGVPAAMSVDEVPADVIRRVVVASSVKESEMKAALPTSVDWASIQTNVQREFEPLLATLSYSDNNEAKARYINAAERLVAEQVGRGVDVRTAARQAYNDLFGNQNVAQGTYRIPKAAGPELVVNGLSNMLREIPVDRVDAQTAEWMTDKDIENERRRQLRTIQAQAAWVNNQSGDGVILTAGGLVVRDVDGNPFEVKFSDAASYIPKTQRPTRDDAAWSRDPRMAR
jgi:hypothetical protein